MGIDLISLYGLYRSIQDEIIELKEGEEIEEFCKVERQNGSYCITLNDEIIIGGFETKKEAYSLYNFLIEKAKEGDI